VTWDVLKLDKSKETKEVQPKNIKSISTTFDVSKPLKFIYIKEEQPLNISLITEILDDSKNSKSISKILEHSSNILFVDVISLIHVIITSLLSWFWNSLGLYAFWLIPFTTPLICISFGEKSL